MQTAQAVFGLTVDDAGLLEVALEDENWAWPLIVERYTALVVSVTSSFRLRSEDAAEVCQEVWTRLFTHRKHIRQPDRLAGWIKTVTRNECLRTCRSSFHEIPADIDAVWTDPVDDDPDGKLLAEEREVALRQAMSRLTGRGRVLLETILEQPGMTHKELASMLDMPVGSIGPTRQRCVRKLRETACLARLQ
jgi:RNA polymerase sigma factor (sigma-70 family)